MSWITELLISCKL